MKMSQRTVVGLGALAAVAGALALAASPHGVSQAQAEAPKVAGPARVDDFMLADQDLLGRQLYRMSDDKAVVLVTYGYNHGEPIHGVDCDGFVDSIQALAW